MSASVKINDTLSVVLRDDKSVAIVGEYQPTKKWHIIHNLDDQSLDRLIEALQAVKIAKESKPFPPEFNSLFGKNVEDLFA